jgi:hypothetical protein
MLSISWALYSTSRRRRYNGTKILSQCERKAMSTNIARDTTYVKHLWKIYTSVMTLRTMLTYFCRLWLKSRMPIITRCKSTKSWASAHILTRCRRRNLRAYSTSILFCLMDSWASIRIQKFISTSSRERNRYIDDTIRFLAYIMQHSRKSWNAWLQLECLKKPVDRLGRRRHLSYPRRMVRYDGYPTFAG